MDHGQQHLLTPRFERKGNVAVVLSPGEGEFARRIELKDPALHPVLFAKTLRPLARWVGELAVAPDKFEWRADLHLHVAGRQPFAAQIAFGEIGPDPLDRARQHALDR